MRPMPCKGAARTHDSSLLAENPALADESRDSLEAVSTCCASSGR